LNGISGAVIVPEEKVRIHGKAAIEIISRFNLREALDLKDGNEVRITEWDPE
jgi:CTP-dependent riboflavin kinase